MQPLRSSCTALYSDNYSEVADCLEHCKYNLCNIYVIVNVKKPQTAQYYDY